MHFCVSMAKIPPTDKSYPAKLMLFGEYTALLGGHVLATPLLQLKANWAYGQKFPHIQMAQLFHEVTKNYPFLTFNHPKWENWVQNLGFLHSDIPVGYGLGSSGNLVAALFDGFFTMETEDKPDFATLKSILGYLESYFHGSSSGVDPLISYTGKTLLFTPDRVEESPIDPQLLDLFHTVDSGQRRNTEALVKDFKVRLESLPFRNHMETLAGLNLHAIEALIAGEVTTLKTTFHEISHLQYNHLHHLITENLMSAWQKGLDTGEDMYKICGAGGGGYFIRL